MSEMSEISEMKIFQNRRVLLGISGGIAAYKIPNLVRLLRKADVNLEIILTRAAEKFVTPLALSTLSGKQVWRDDDFLADDSGFKIPHVNLSRDCEIIVIAPCSANTIAKIAHGYADDLLSAAVLAKNDNSHVMIFPAMNENMFENPATRENLRILSDRGFVIIDPEFGELACGVSGKGRMPEPGEIFHEICRLLNSGHNHKLLGKRVLVTAGATQEFLDPVRFISNPSSGKMGVAFGRAAWLMGADVKIILGAANHDLDLYGLKVQRVVSALDMLEAVTCELENYDYIVKAAAVGDYRAREISERKIKRQNREVMNLELIQNPDIAAEIGKRKRKNQILIGFAAETDDLRKNAREKLLRKNLDYILANDVSAKDSGFAVDTNTLRLIAKEPTTPERIFSGFKDEISLEIWDYLTEIAG